MTDGSTLGLNKAAAHEHLQFAGSLAETQNSDIQEAVVLAAQAQEGASEKLQADQADDGPFIANIKLAGKEKEETKTKKVEKAERAQESVLVRKDEADGLADGFSKRRGNREYRFDPRLLSQLAEDLGIAINEESNPDELIAFIRNRMVINGQQPDVSIVDKAFEFLMEVAKVQIGKSKGEPKERLEKILKNLDSAKLKHFSINADKIQVAEKIIGAADALVESTQGSSHQSSINQALDRCRDIVHTPPDLQSLRKHYEAKGYKLMILELKGLNAYLGGNLKRTNLEGPELGQLRNSVVKMQALLGVFRQAKASTPTMTSFLSSKNLFDS